MHLTLKPGVRILNTHHHWISVALTSAALAACGGGGGSSAASPTPTPAAAAAPAPVETLSGRVIDGPLSGAKVFIDLDGDLIQADSEPSVQTDADGKFELPFVEASEASAGATLKLVSIGGTDTSTGKALPNIALVSDVPASADSAAAITPLSTIIAAATTPEAKKAVLVSLGVSGTVEDFLKRDVWAEAEAGDASAINIQKANLSISAVLQSATSLVDTSDGSTAVANATNIMNALAAQFVTQAVAGADLFDTAVLTAVLTQGVTTYAAISEPDLVIAAEVFAAVAASVATLVVVIEGTANPTDAAAIAVATTVQESLQTAVAAVAASGDTAAFRTDSSTEILFAGASDAVAAIVSLDTDGDGIINTLDPDIDNDGVANALDKFPLDRFETLDTDKDGIGNNADKDDDGDGFSDALDAFPLDATKSTFASGSSIQGLALPSAITVLETE